MLTKTYTMVIGKDYNDENFKELITRISKCGDIKKIANVDEMGWTVLKIETGRARWQRLIGMLNREMNITPYKMIGCWFI